MKTRTLLIAAMSVMVALVGGVSGQDFPKPKLRLVSVSDTVKNGYQVKLYEVEVVNREEFDNELFVPSPALPACGVNRSASRTWVDIFNEKGARIYGFCALKVNGELATLRFSVPADRPQPKKIFIDLVDRFEERVVRSNTVSVE